jgi:hypothetical protein
LITYVTSFLGFAPPRTEDKPENVTSLLDDIEASNKEVTGNSEAFKKAVDTRQSLFKGRTGSMSKLLAPIMGAIEAQYEKKSVEYKLLLGFVRKIRSSRVEKAPTNPDDADAKAKISASTRSYGSLTQHFDDIITNLEGFTAYKPTNTNITVESLTALSTSMKNANKALDGTFEKRSSAIDKRLALFADLKDRVQRIKAYTKSEYGFDSREFKLIKGIDV